MKILVATLSFVAALLLLAGRNSESTTPIASLFATSDAIASNSPVTYASNPTNNLGLTNAALSEVVKTYCAGCHSERLKTGNLVLEGFNVDSAPQKLEITEKMIRKLR